MAVYLAIPRASNIPVVVATGTAVKTVLQVAVPAAKQIDKIIAWGISFAGVDGAAVPGICSLMDTDVAATVTSLTPIIWRDSGDNASDCVGGASATGYNGSAEGTIGSSTRDLDSELVHPQQGYSCWFPDLWQPKVNASRFLRVRTTFAVSVNCLPWILWGE
jgi:hypothetical protein